MERYKASAKKSRRNIIRKRKDEKNSIHNNDDKKNKIKKNVYIQITSERMKATMENKRNERMEKSESDGK